jgi:hypothetical protein
MTQDTGQATHAILDVVVPRGTAIDLLHLLTWVDRLVRDLKVVPDQYKFSEYGAAFSPAKVKSEDGRDVEVTIYLDIDIAAPARAAAVSLPETAAA